MKELDIAINKLQSYIESEQYKGFDPYDGLSSFLFHLPIFNKNKKIRFLGQQFIKRFPFNIRPFLGIKKELNPVTIGLCLQAYSNLWVARKNERILIEEKINFLLSKLINLQSKNYHGACWGYNFDWEARYATIPAYEPTVVATGFITNALFRLYQQTGNITAKNLVISACDFVLNDLNRTYDHENNFCFSYSPFDKEQVFNANMKGARLLAQGYHLTKNNDFKVHASKAISWVMKYQHDNGAWIYSNSKVGTWIDNYHTGYNLDCLEAYIKYCNDNNYLEHLTKGITFYKNNFFEKNGQPRFYNQNMWPADCTAGAQSILTLCKFNARDSALKTALWMIKNMQDEKGYFYFRRNKYRIMKTSFMRWSNSWMFASLTELLIVENI